MINKHLALFLSIFTVFLMAMPIAHASTTTYVSTNIHFGFAANTYLTFNTAQTFTSLYKTSGTWHFDSYEVTMQTANTTITSWFTSDWLNYTVTNAGTQTFTGCSTPGTVYLNGAETESGWTYAGSTLTVTGATSTAAVNFVASPGEYDYGGGTDALLPYLLDGDIIGFIVAVYTSKIGMAFYGILILIVSGVFYNRTKSLAFLSIVWILLGGVFIAVTWIFSPIAIVLLALGLTGIIYQLVEKEST